MKRIFYAGGSALVTNELADAVLNYAEVLATSSTQADVVRIPVVLDSGHAGEAHMLIGPASQLFSLSEEAELLNLPDDSFVVAELQRKARLAGSPRPMTNHTEPEVMELQDEYE